jgi:hypothetical protein
MFFFIETMIAKKKMKQKINNEIQLLINSMWKDKPEKNLSSR